MTADEPLGQRAERLARCMDAIARQSTIYNGLDRINAKDAAATLRALATANEALVKARDAEKVRADMNFMVGTQWQAERDAALARATAAEAQAGRLREAAATMDATLSSLWTGGPQNDGSSVYLGAVDDAWASLRATLAGETGAPA